MQSIKLSTLTWTEVL